MAHLARLGPLLIVSALACANTTHAARPVTQAAPVTITVAFDRIGPPPYYEEQWWEKAKERIEAANSTVHVTLMPIAASEDDYHATIARLLRSGNPAPDIVRDDSVLIGADAAAGILAPLDPYLAAWPGYSAQWFPAMRNITTFNVHNYGIMNGTDARLIWYNKDVFKRAGLSTTWQPRSWRDILATAQTIKRRVPGVIPLNVYAGLPIGEATAMQGFEMLLYGTQDTLYDSGTKRWVVSSKGFLDSLAFVRAVYGRSNRLGPPENIASSPDVYQDIVLRMLPRGEVGIDIDGSYVPGGWYPNGTAPWPRWRQAMGVAKMPTQFGQGSRYVTLSGGYAYAINARSQHKAAAFRAIEIADAKDLLAFYNTHTATITPRKDVVALPSYARVPLNTFFTSLLNVTRFRPDLPMYPRISHEIATAVNDVMSGASPSQAMASYARAVTGIVGAANVERSIERS